MPSGKWRWKHSAASCLWQFLSSLGCNLLWVAIKQHFCSLLGLCWKCVSDQIPGNTERFKFLLKRTRTVRVLTPTQVRYFFGSAIKEGSRELQFPQSYSVFILKGVWLLKLSNEHLSSQADKAKWKFHGNANATFPFHAWKKGVALYDLIQF